jgi:hypothetical protein
MFITGGENDPKVFPFHARKLAARMQEANTSDNPILLKIQKNAGHDGGLSDTRQILRKVDGLVFLMHQLEMTPRRGEPICCVPHGMGDLYAAQFVCVGFHSSQGEGAHAFMRITTKKMIHETHEKHEKKTKKICVICVICGSLFLIVSG